MRLKMRTTATTLLTLPLLLSAARCRNGEPDLYLAHGTVEVRQINVAPTVAARVLAIKVDEGDQVWAGDTLATLTRATLPAEIDAQRAQLAEARAQLRDLESGPRKAEIQAARSELSSAQAEADRTARDRDRLAELQKAGAVSRQDFEKAATIATQAAERRDIAANKLRLLEEGTRQQQIQAARARVAQAESGLEAALATAADLVLTASVDGVILERHVEPGETIAAGTPAVTIGRTSEPWVRVYVPARALPALQPGGAAVITTVGIDREIRGVIASINSEAEFTPRVALTRDERADELFGVRVNAIDSTGILKAGMPATVRFLVDSTARKEPR